MTTTTVPVPSGEELAAAFTVLGEEDFTHREWACRPDVALCGQQFAGDDYFDADDPCPKCPECEAIDRAKWRTHVLACAVCRDSD